MHKVLFSVTVLATLFCSCSRDAAEGISPSNKAKSIFSSVPSGILTKSYVESIYLAQGYKKVSSIPGYTLSKEFLAADSLEYYESDTANNGEGGYAVVVGFKDLEGERAEVAFIKCDKQYLETPRSLLGFSYIDITCKDSGNSCFWDQRVTTGMFGEKKIVQVIVQCY